MQTLGFGSDAASDLLAELGTATAFISDASMAVNVFAHFLANEQVRKREGRPAVRRLYHHLCTHYPVILYPLRTLLSRTRAVHLRGGRRPDSEAARRSEAQSVHRSASIRAAP